MSELQLPTQRYMLTIAYRGTAYHGWQYQEPASTWKGPIPKPGQGLPTVQEHIRRALIHVVKHPVNLVGSSRTDAGVHAKGQIAHFDTDKIQILPSSIKRATNARLPGDILVRKVQAVDSSFSAIACTRAKRYQYMIWNTEDRPSPFIADLCWHRRKPLDIDAIRAAAAMLVGTHDFASFCKPGHKRFSTVRTIYSLDVHSRPPRLVIGVTGNGFLWQMVRIIVGTLVEVGLGLYRPADIAGMIEARDRRAGGYTAPPQGLFLHWIQTAVAHQSPEPSPREEDEPE